MARDKSVKVWMIDPDTKDFTSDDKRWVIHRHVVNDVACRVPQDRFTLREFQVGHTVGFWRGDFRTKEEAFKCAAAEEEEEEEAERWGKWGDGGEVKPVETFVVEPDLVTEGFGKITPHEMTVVIHDPDPTPLKWGAWRLGDVRIPGPHTLSKCSRWRVVLTKDRRGNTEAEVAEKPPEEDEFLWRGTFSSSEEAMTHAATLEARRDVPEDDEEREETPEPAPNEPGGVNTPGVGDRPATGTWGRPGVRIGRKAYGILVMRNGQLSQILETRAKIAGIEAKIRETEEDLKVAKTEAVHGWGGCPKCRRRQKRIDQLGTSLSGKRAEEEVFLAEIAARFLLDGGYNNFLSGEKNVESC